MSNALVDGVVPTDIFAEDDGVAVAVEEGGGVQTTRLVEGRLGLPERLRQRRDEPGVDDGRGGVRRTVNR